MTRYGHRLSAAALASLFAIVAAGGRMAFAAEPGSTDPHVQLFSRAVATTSEFSASFVQERDGISVLALDGDYDRGLAEPRAELARSFYERHGDDYDFLVVFTSFAFPLEGAAAFASLVRNDVKGIGVALFDNGAAFGSHSRLGAIVDMGRLASWSTQPSEASFEHTLTTLLHELQHRWGARVRFRQADGTLSTALLGRDGAHWSYLLDSDASVHYGHDWRDNGDGTFTAEAVERRLSPLDLYLAGFASQSEVPPFFLVDSPGVDPTQLPRLHATIGGTKRAVTIDQVIGAEGPRIPAATAAPRKLRTAFLLVLRPGEVPSEAQIQGISRVRRELPARFAAATGGRGLMEVSRPLEGPSEPGTPDPEDGGDPRPGANLEAARAWLRGRQDEAGSWQDRVGTRVRDTAIALSALANDAQFGGGLLARNWLASRVEVAVDGLARRASALGVESLGSPILALQNADGGWGIAAGYRSDPIDTGLALVALAPHGAAASVASATGYLVRSQNTDGGWGSVEAGPSRTSATALALRALIAAGVDNGRAGGVAFLLSRQNADGGFGDSPSSSHDTALALDTLRLLGALQPTAREAGLQYLSSRQDVSGSWEGSIYSTAVAALALEGLAAPPPPEPVDLEVLASDLVLQGTAVVGGDVVFRATVRNRGTDASPPFAVRFRVGDGTTVRDVATLTLQLDAGESFSRDVPWRVDLAGDLQLTVELDAGQVVGESDETNNLAILPFRAEPPTEANLAVVHTDLAIAPDPAREGRPLDVSVMVRNLGGGTATNVFVAFFDGDPTAGGVEIGRANLATLDAGVAAPATIRWPRVPTPADRQVHVVVDPENQLAEPNEDDNRTFRAVTVLSLPDLAVGAGSIRLQPRFPVQGQPAQATVVVGNLGEQETTFTVRLLGGLAAGAGAQLAPDQEVTIAGKGSAEASFSWSFADGTSVLTAVVDPSSAVEEGSEANNIAALSVTEQQGDFFVDERHLSPNGDGVRDRTTLFFSLETPATVAVEVWDPQRDRVVRRHAGADWEGVREGSFTWDGRDAAGRVVRDTTWVLRVVDAAGRELGTSWAIVDTDRSSLLEAAGTPFESVANLTCQLDEPEDPVLTADEQWVYFLLNFATTLPHGNGIYRIRPTGADLQTIVPKTWFGTDDWPIAVTVSPDGAHVLFVTDSRELWIVEGSGGTPRRLAPTTTPPRLGDYPWDVLGFDARGRAIFRDGFGAIFAIAPSGGTPTRLIGDSNLLPRPILSPDRKRIAVHPYILGAQVVDLTRDLALELPAPGERLTDLAWSHDGRMLAATFESLGSDEKAGVLVYDAEGRLLQRLEVPVDPRASFFDDFYETQPGDEARPTSFRSVNAFAPAWLGADEVALMASWTGEGGSPDVSALVASEVGFGAPRVVEWLPYRDQFDLSTAASAASATALGERAPVASGERRSEPTPSVERMQLFPFWFPALHGDPAARSLLLRPTEAYLLDEDRKADVLASPEDGFPVGFSPSGRNLLIAADAPSDESAGPCRGRSSFETDLYAVRSLHNLTAELHSRKSTAAGVVFEGTAADRHLASWRLDYASSQSPADWHPIEPPSDVPVLGGWLATWAPPGPGTFHVRLLVEDLAGNTRSRTRTLTFAETPTVTDLQLTPRYFSPNGDGVLETAKLQYRVLQPAHLLIEVRDAAGRAVRRFQRDHAQAGVTAELSWDGRDDAGRRVVDGLYTVTLLGYELFVRLDTTAPSVTLTVNGPGACQTEGRRDVGGAVNLTASDATDELAPLRLFLERGEGESPPSWIPARGGRVSFADLVGYRYRGRVFDAAGNRTIVTKDLVPERLLLLGAEPTQQAPSTETCGTTPGDPINPQPLRLRMAEAVRRPVHQVFVQHQPLPIEPGDWTDVPLEPLAPLDDSGRFDLVWDMAGVEAGQKIAVRVRVLDAGGADHFSSSFELALDGLSLRKLSPSELERLAENDPPTAGALRSLLRAAGLDVRRDEVLWGRALLPPGSDPPQVVMSSPEREGVHRPDPRYQPPVVFETIGSGPLFIAVPDPLSACHVYAAQATAVTPSGTVSSPLVDFLLPCLALGLEVTGPAPGACGEPPATSTARLTVTPRALDGQVLQLLAVHGPGRDGQRTLLASENHPESAVEVTLDLNLADMPEGEHPVDATLRSVTGEEVVEDAVLRVDRTPPVVGITYPLVGQRVCGVPRDGRNVVEVEGFVRDEQAACYEVIQGEDDRPPSMSNGNCGSDLRGVLGTVTDSVGDTWLRLDAVDHGGNRTCTETTFHFDALAEAEPRSDVLHVTSPNSDGVRDAVELVLDVLEPGELAVDVLPGTIYFDDLQLAWDCRPTSTPVRALVAETPAAGPTPFTWDGKDGSGTSVPDGGYVVAARLRDACGNENVHRFCVATDTTAPELEITSPLPGEVLPLIVEVHGSVSDVSAVPRVIGNPQWRLEYGAGAAPDQWTPIAHGSNRPGGFLGRWNTLGLSGDFTLRLQATDPAGNESVLHVPVTLASPSELLAELVAEPRLFSPNADGRREQAGIRTALSVEALLDLTVERLGGPVVRRLLLGARLAAGTHTVAWDGRDDTGTLVADGLYRVVATARLQAHPLVTQTERVSVVVDRTPPHIEVTLPGAFAAPGSAVAGSIEDANLESLRVELTTTPDAPVWRELFRDTQSRTGITFGTLDGLEEGEHALRFVARDLGEIGADRVVRFVVDATPPVTELISPQAGEVVGAAEGAVHVSGTASDDHLAVWSLELGAGNAPSSWSLLADGANSTAASTLFAWTPSGLPDGLYVLRLTATDQAGLRTEARRAVVVDNTAPQAALTAPADGAWITGPLVVTGTANDPRLVRFTISAAPGAPGESTLFAPIATALLPVTNGALASWSALPADGTHTLRLRVEDAGGNRAIVERLVRVDTTAPAPALGLVASAQGRDVQLQWTASPSPDVAGYLLVRDGVRLWSTPRTGTSTIDAQLEDGLHRYTVIAVDHAGWESEPSDPAELTIDLEPPVAAIHVPAHGSRVSGLIAITGTAASAEDFREYRLAVAPAAGGTWQELRRSVAPVSAGPLGEWSTIGLAEDASYQVRLEAEDTRGNVATAFVEVTIDNRPPAAPTGLTVTLTSATAALSWNVNAELDLAGYLLYRDGQIANASGPVIGELAPFLLRAPNYSDANLPDGAFRWEVLAMDLAGNLSDPSAPATASLDRRPPAAQIVIPASGTTFDGALYVLATTPDTDVATVRFEHSADGNAWVPIGSADTAPPWETTWEPSGLAHGERRRLRAVATDAGDRSDPAPVSIEVVFDDVSPPAAVEGLRALAAGGNVQLSWEPSSEGDLAGYLVERQADSATWTRITTSPIVVAELLDTGLADGEHPYRVVAVDGRGNESGPAIAVARVWTPSLEQPYTPIVTTATSLAGAGVPGLQAVGEILSSVGLAHLPPVATDAAGRFAWDPVPLMPGENLLVMRQLDADGATSRDASAVVRSDAAPAPPTSVRATAGSDLRAEVTWDPSSETDLLGYRIVRDGHPTPPAAALAPLSATASVSDTPPAEAVDGNPATTWWVQWNPEGLYRGEWFEVRWSGQRLLSRVEIDWDAAGFPPDYDLLAWDGRVWVPLARKRGAGETVTVLEPAPSYLTDRVRVLLQGGVQAGIAELRVLAVQHQATTSFVETLPDGDYAYAVVAIDRHGLQSAPAPAEVVGVGDREPPLPVTLAGEVTGADTFLSWSSSADAVRYRVHRDGLPVGETAEGEPREHDDLALLNGTYRYVVTALDAVGNESGPSNEVTLEVALPLLGAPRQLSATAVHDGLAIDLVWLPPAGAAPAAYRVHRSLHADGPYSPLASTASTSRSDADVVAGQTYHYVVTALDTLGNAGPPSNEASATTVDQQAPAPPVLHFPGFAGAPAHTTTARADVGGSAEPGSTVALFRAGSLAGQANASLEESRVDLGLFPGGLVSASPNGSLLWDGADGVLYRLADGAVAAEPSFSGAGGWFADSRRLLVADGGEIQELDALTGATRSVATLDLVEMALPSPEGRLVAVIGARGGEEGMLLLDLGSGGWSTLVESPAGALVASTLAWSPDGQAIAYRRAGAGALEVLVLGEGSPRLVAGAAASGGPSWSPDGSRLAFTTQEAGSSRLQFWDRASGGLQTLEESAGLSQPQWSADGESIAFVNDAAGGNVELIGVDEGARQALLDGVVSPSLLAWSRRGELVAVHGDGVTTLLPAGAFLIPGVSLAPGDNALHAEAADAAGNVSAPSATMVIRRHAGGAPDLVVGSLQIVPTFPLVAQPARIGVEVSNLGQSPAAASRLILGARAPDGTYEELASGAAVPALGPGASFTFQLESSFLTAGRHLLLAVVDAESAVAEADEGNNRAESPFHVAEEGVPAILVATDRRDYLAQQTAEVSAEAIDFGAPFAGTIVLRIEDSAGELVEELLRETVALEHAESWEATRPWSTGDLFAGEYQAVGELRDAGGALVSRAAAPLRILGSSRLAASIEAERPAYRPGATVRLESRIDYVFGNAAVSGAQAVLRLLGAGDAALGELEHPLGDLLPGSSGTVHFSWPSAGAPNGTVRALLDVRHEGASVASAEGVFRLAATPGRVRGALTLADSLPPVGSRIEVEAVVTNDTAGDLAAVPVRLVQRRAAEPQALAATDWALDLPIGVDVSRTTTFDTSLGGLGSFLLVLEAQVGGIVVALDSVGFTTRDAGPPRLELLVPLPGSLLAGHATASAVAVDALSPLRTVEGEVDGGNAQLMPLASLADGRHTLSLSTLSEGPHQLLVRAEDSWGNAATVGPVAFTIDRTPPEIRVDGVIDDEQYEDPVAPRVEVHDAHPGTSSVTLDGAPFVSGTPVDALGTHELRVHARDAAGNETERTVRFVLRGGEPRLRVLKTDALLADADASGGASPGDTLEYSLVVLSDGGVAARGVVLVDPLPAALTLQPDSVEVGEGLALAGTSPLTLTAVELQAGLQATARFRVLVGAAAAASSVVANQATASAEGVAATLSDDPDTAAPSDATATPVVLAPPSPPPPPPPPPVPEIRLGDVDVAEGNSGLTSVVIPMTIDPPPATDLTLSFATAAGSAVPGVDYEERAGTITLPAGARLSHIEVFAIGDRAPEDDESFLVRALPSPTITLGDDTGVVTIFDDDGDGGGGGGGGGPRISIEVLDASIAEGDEAGASLGFEVVLSAPAATEVRVRFATRPGSATEGADYEAGNGELRFAPGTRMQTVLVPVLADRLLEEDETLTLELSRPSGARLRDSVGVGTILDDDVCLGPELIRNGGGEDRTARGEPLGWTPRGAGWRRLRASSPVPFAGETVLVAVASGELFQDTSLVAYARPIDLGTQSFALSARVRTLGDVRANLRLEYLSAEGELLDAFESGPLEATPSWREVVDARTAPPGSRTARVRLLVEEPMGEGASALVDAVSLRSFGTATLTVPPTAALEGHEGERVAYLAVSLSCPYGHPISVEHETAGGTAKTGDDYVPAAGTVELPPGEVAAGIPIRILGDRVVERHETVTIELGGLVPADDAVLLHPATSLTVRNDDSCPSAASWWSRRRIHVFPQPWLEVGGVELELKDMKALLTYRGKDAASALAREAVAAELNVLRGSDLAIAPVLAQADALLAAHPPASSPLGRARRQALRLMGELQKYNQGGCTR